MRSKKIVLIALALGIVVAAVWMIRSNEQSRDLTFSSTIETRLIEVGSLVGGRVRSVRVEEGQRVDSGDVLVEFEPDLSLLQITEQESQVAQAQAALDKLVSGPRRKELNRARLDWSNA